MTSLGADSRAFIQQKLNEFPCSFNIGRANYQIDGRGVDCTRICEVPCVKNTWERYVSYDIPNSSDDTWIPLEWEQNYRIKAYVEVGRFEEARKLIDEVLYKTEEQNMTTMANLAVLYFEEGKVEEADDVVKQLNELSSLISFKYLKADALCEQAYFYFEFANAEKNISGIELLNFALKFPIRYKHEADLMLGILHRRCLHWSTYDFAKEKIDFGFYVKDAFKILSALRYEINIKDIVKAHALVELAMLRNTVTYVNNDYTQTIAFNGTVETLCDEALTLAPSSANVTAIVGQLMRYVPGRTETAKQLLGTSLNIKPTGRAYHHLGLILLKEAKEFEHIHGTRAIRTLSLPLGDNIEQELNMDRVLQRLLSQAKEIPPFSSNNPFIQDATENLHQYLLYSAIRTKIPAVVSLGHAYIRCRAYDRALEIYDRLNACDTDWVHKMVLAYGHLMSTLCLLLKSEVETNETQTKTIRDKCLTLLIKAVSLWEEISEAEVSSFEPSKILESLRRIPKYHDVPPNLLPKLNFKGQHNA
ncbi:unnamed protein product [Lymnaea stagnalis]|uniref:Tetratricopeptide repeat protein n=1 Tax=Lymnaea stagnalis TaxID=6523 RepID=A0AAV2GYQ4_LYMST